VIVDQLADEVRAELPGFSALVRQEALPESG
jgi:hypothetical protein